MWFHWPIAAFLVRLAEPTMLTHRVCPTWLNRKIFECRCPADPRHDRRHERAKLTSAGDIPCRGCAPVAEHALEPVVRRAKALLVAVHEQLHAYPALVRLDQRPRHLGVGVAERGQPDPGTARGVLDRLEHPVPDRVAPGGGRERVVERGGRARAPHGLRLRSRLRLRRARLRVLARVVLVRHFLGGLAAASAGGTRASASTTTRPAATSGASRGKCTRRRSVTGQGC